MGIFSNIRGMFIHVSGKTSKYEKDMRRLQLVNKKTTQAISMAWVKAAGATYGAMKAWDIAKLGARAKQTAQAFENMAISHGQNADKMIKNLKEASAHTVDTMTLMQKAGTAMMLGIAPDRIANLMKIARASARLTGQEVSKAFDDIALGVGRQSRRILDNLGIIVEIGKANAAYAKEMGIVGRKLNDTEQRLAFLNMTADKGREMIKRIGVQSKTSAEKFASFETSIRNLATELGEFLLVLAPVIEGMTFLGKMAKAPTTGEVLTKRAIEVQEKINQLEQRQRLGERQLGRPLPQFSKRIAELKEYMRTINRARALFHPDTTPFAASPEAIALVGRITPKPLGGGGAGDGTDTTKTKAGRAGKPTGPFAHMAKARLNLAIQAARDENAIAMQRIAEEKRLDMELFQWKIEKASEYDQAIMSGHENMLAYEKQVNDQRIAEEKRVATMKKQAQFDTLNNMIMAGKMFMQATSSQNKTLFELVKAASTAKAIINTYEGVTKALAQGGFWGMAMAASVFTFGMAQVAQIRAQTLAGTGGGAGAGVPATTPATAPTVAPGQTAAAGTGGKPVFNFYIDGDVVGDQAWLEKIASKLSEAVQTSEVRLHASGANFANQTL